MQYLPILDFKHTYQSMHRKHRRKHRDHSFGSIIISAATTRSNCLHCPDFQLIIPLSKSHQCYKGLMKVLSKQKVRIKILGITQCLLNKNRFPHQPPQSTYKSNRCNHNKMQKLIPKDGDGYALNRCNRNK